MHGGGGVVPASASSMIPDILTHKVGSLESPRPLPSPPLPHLPHPRMVHLVALPLLSPPPLPFIPVSSSKILLLRFSIFHLFHQILNWFLPSFHPAIDPIFCHSSVCCTCIKVRLCVTLNVSLCMSVFLSV